MPLLERERPRPSPIARRLVPVFGAAAASAVIGFLAAKSGWLLSLLDPAFSGHWSFYLMSTAIWALFSSYWTIAPRKSAPAASSESASSRRVHVLLVNSALSLILPPVQGVGRFVAAKPMIMAIGLAIQLAGIGLAMWVRRNLGLNWSGKIAIAVEHRLVRTGPYRSLRHPIHTGLLLMYLGTALVMGEWHALLGLGLAFYAYCRKIRLEEAALDRAFGAGYEEYRRSTWALVSGFF